VPNFEPIRATNPCSEFIFPDDTACNLASLNLKKFLLLGGGFNVQAYRKAVRVFITAQEILVGLGSYPTPAVAENSYKLRPLGLGYANLGASLMMMGLPYDSDEGRGFAAAVTSLTTAEAYLVSAEIASHMGPFEHFEANRTEMLCVIGEHGEASLRIRHARASLLNAAADSWASAYRAGEKHGFRNAQATVLAPTGTIGLLMDCDTTGLEPDFALVKWKGLAGGGFLRIINESVFPALDALGYTKDEVQDIRRWVLGNHVDMPPHLWKWLCDMNLAVVGSVLRKAALEATSDSIEAATDAETAAVMRRDNEALYRELELHVFGRGTVEGAPHLKPEHAAIFDCANSVARRASDSSSRWRMFTCSLPSRRSSADRRRRP
jgi:ribonucleoside-diphosphate reductase alpha chain